MNEPAIDSLVWLAVPSELGDIGLVASAEALVGLLLPSRKAAATAVRQRFAPAEPRRGTNPVLALVAHDLKLYLAGGHPGFSAPLAFPYATEYERAVYDTIRMIPFGETRPYGWVADHAGGSPQSAGNALGKNPLPIIVPCHRVVAAHGLGGFTGGLPLKRKLLELERASPMNQFEIPLATPIPGAGRQRSRKR